MKRKAQRTPKIGGAKTATLSPPENQMPVSLTEQEEAPALTVEATFAIQQYYSIQPAEHLIDNFIDQHWRSFSSKEEERQRFKRMYRAIIANEKALSRVLQYVALAEHDAKLEDSGYDGYVEEYFKRPTEFTDILTSVCSLFTPEDKQWWEEFVQLHQEQPQAFDLSDQVGPLYHAFTDNCQPSGWQLLRVSHHCHNCGSSD